jgi:hypothetical protein
MTELQLTTLACASPVLIFTTAMGVAFFFLGGEHE